MIKNSKSKKLLLKIAIICITFTLILFICVKVINAFEKNKTQDTTSEQQVAQKKETIMFYPIDFDENIFEDEEYLAKNSFVKFVNNSFSQTLTDGKEGINDEYAKFFVDYFDCIKNGNYEKYSEFFTENYENSSENYKFIAKIDEEFTMQKLYDIEVERYYTDVDNFEQSEKKIAFFNVTYRILKNNGTFRSDLPDNAAIPLLFELQNFGGVIKINSIKEYSSIK